MNCLKFHHVERPTSFHWHTLVILNLSLQHYYNSVIVIILLIFSGVTDTDWPLKTVWLKFRSQQENLVIIRTSGSASIGPQQASSAKQKHSNDHDRLTLSGGKNKAIKNMTVPARGLPFPTLPNLHHCQLENSHDYSTTAYRRYYYYSTLPERPYRNRKSLGWFCLIIVLLHIQNILHTVHTFYYTLLLFVFMMRRYKL